MLTMQETSSWASIDVSAYPKLVTAEIPGPKSKAMHARAAGIMKGLGTRETVHG